MKKVISFLCILGVSLLLGGQIAWAGKPLYANVTANALCTVDDTDVLVDAGLIQKDAPSSGPVVSTVVVFLEQHFPNQKDWKFVGGTEVKQDVNIAFDLLDAGERYGVATQDYSDVCNLGVSQDANAVRAVVQITVDNANIKRPGGNVFTGRCVSFPNPCK